MVDKLKLNSLQDCYDAVLSLTISKEDGELDLASFFCEIEVINDHAQYILSGQRDEDRENFVVSEIIDENGDVL